MKKLFALFAVFALGSAHAASRVDPQADALLRKMSGYLASQGQFSVRADGATEVVLKDGEKLQFDYESNVKIHRPNMLRSDRLGEKTAAAFFYDGKTFTLFGARANYFATAPAPATIDEAIDSARERLGVEAPGADLLYKDPYKILMEDVVSGTYLGTATIRDVPCDHLAFRGGETDWEIWIENGAKPLPRKLVVTSKKVVGAPEYSAEFSEWNFSPKFNSQTFHFTPPADATRVEFMPVSASSGQTGEHR